MEEWTFRSQFERWRLPTPTSGRVLALPAAGWRRDSG